MTGRISWLRAKVHRAFVVEPADGKLFRARMRYGDGTPTPDGLCTEQGSLALVVDAALSFSDRTGVPVLLSNGKGKGFSPIPRGGL